MTEKNKLYFDIFKLDIKINAIKIISLWGASAMICVKIGTVYNDFLSKISRYENYEKEIKNNTEDIKELKQWQNNMQIKYPQFNIKK